MAVESWATLIGVGVAGAALVGFVVAMVARRVSPTSPFIQTWLFYTALVAFLMAAVLVIGLT